MPSAVPQIDGPAAEIVNAPLAYVALPFKPTAPMSPSCMGYGSTLNVAGLLLFMLGATATVIGPEVAPGGMVTPTEVSLHESICVGNPFRRTSLLPCVAPNPVPVMVTLFPGSPVDVDSEEIVGAGVAAVVTDTLSNSALTRALLLVFPLLTANPI